jgi:Pyruvate/2-oxoacid:ferredoxin oxidoreductase delta subunit
VKNGKYLKSAIIGRAIMDADVFISLTHFKGHEATGFGGAIKNIGMGCGSRAGKMKMHCDGKPTIDKDLCVGCRKCAAFCAQDAFSYANGKASIDHGKCVGCGFCIGSCNFHAIESPYDSSNEVLNCKMAEYTAAVLDGRPSFHVSVVNQVSPYCDCHSENDAAVVPDIGIFAGFDPVAIDHACIDAVNAAPPIMSSIMSERSVSGKDLHRHPSHHRLATADRPRSRDRPRQRRLRIDYRQIGGGFLWRVWRSFDAGSRYSVVQVIFPMAGNGTGLSACGTFVPTPRRRRSGRTLINGPAAPFSAKNKNT